MIASSARGGLFGREVAVGPAHREDVVGADPDSVGIVQLHDAILEHRERRGVVHDARPAAVGGGHVVVREPDGVSHLVGRELRHPGESQVHRGGPLPYLREVGKARRRREPAGVRPVGVRRQADRQVRRRRASNGATMPTPRRWSCLSRRLPRFTLPLMISPVRGSRTPAAVGPAAGAAMGPVDHAVADVLGVGALRQHARPGYASMNPAASNASAHQRAPSISAVRTGSGTPRSR